MKIKVAGRNNMMGYKIGKGERANETERPVVSVG